MAALGDHLARDRRMLALKLAGLDTRPRSAGVLAAAVPRRALATRRSRLPRGLVFSVRRTRLYCTSADASVEGLSRHVFPGFTVPGAIGERVLAISCRAGRLDPRRADGADSNVIGAGGDLAGDPRERGDRGRPRRRLHGASPPRCRSLSGHQRDVVGSEQLSLPFQFMLAWPVRRRVGAPPRSLSGPRPAPAGAAGALQLIGCMGFSDRFGSRDADRQRLSLLLRCCRCRCCAADGRLGSAELARNAGAATRRKRSAAPRRWRSVFAGCRWPAGNGATRRWRNAEGPPPARRRYRRAQDADAAAQSDRRQVILDKAVRPTTTRLYNAHLRLRPRAWSDPAKNAVADAAGRHRDQRRAARTTYEDGWPLDRWPSGTRAYVAYDGRRGLKRDGRSPYFIDIAAWSGGIDVSIRAPRRRPAAPRPARQ